MCTFASFCPSESTTREDCRPLKHHCLSSQGRRWWSQKTLNIWSRVSSHGFGARERCIAQFWHAYARMSEADRLRSRAPFAKPTKAMMSRTISISPIEVRCSGVVEEGFRLLNARNTGSIKKSGKLLNRSIARKARRKDDSGVVVNSLIASTVLENSSIRAHKDAAGVDCHA
jgi:hypothetical protein